MDSRDDSKFEVEMGLFGFFESLKESKVEWNARQMRNGT